MKCGICQGAVYCLDRYRCPETNLVADQEREHLPFHYSCVANRLIEQGLDNQPPLCPMPECNAPLPEVVTSCALGRFESMLLTSTVPPYSIIAAGLISLGTNLVLGPRAVSTAAVGAAIVGAVISKKFPELASRNIVNKSLPDCSHYHAQVTNLATNGGLAAEFTGHVITGIIAGASGPASSTGALLLGFAAGTGVFFTARFARSVGIDINRKTRAWEAIWSRTAKQNAPKADIQMRTEFCLTASQALYEEVLSPTSTIATASVVALSVLACGGGKALATMSGLASLAGTYLSRKLFDSLESKKLKAE